MFNPSRIDRQAKGVWMSTPSIRAQRVSEANHSVYLEGLAVSPEYASDTEHYIAGEISADELVRITRARYGLK